MSFQEAVSGKTSWILTALCLALGIGCAPPMESPSVLLITLDTTRADRLGAYGKDGAGTQNLDALAEEGTLFEWAFTTTPITLPAHASILTGTYPERHGVRDNGWVLQSELVTLAEVLHAADYRTAAFVSAFPLYSRFGLDRGFEVYDDELPIHRTARRNSRQRFAQEVVEDASAWLTTVDPDDPFFLWVHFFDPHNTYLPPAPYFQWYASDLYQGEIAYMDEWIGKLLTSLKESGRDDNTIVAVVADHGEALGQHGERTHAQLVYNSTMRVPLILRGAQIDAGRRVSDPVSVVDLFPTLLELLSLKIPKEVQGISLVPALRGAPISPRPVYFESLYTSLHHGWSELRSIVIEGWKYIEAPSASGQEELYELVVDPEELDNRFSELPDVAQRLRNELNALHSLPTDPSRLTLPPPLAEEERLELEALGYLTASTQPLGKKNLHPRDGMQVFDLYQDAIDRIQGGRLHLALPLVERIEREYPGSLLAHKARGRFWIERGTKDPSVLPLALKELESALALAPNSPDEQRYIAEAHFALGDWPAGLRVFAETTRSAPHRADLASDYQGLLVETLQHVDEQERTGQFEQALTLIETLIEIEPENSEAARRARALRQKIESD